MGSMNWAGNARGKIIEFGIFEAESGAVAVSIKAAIVEYFDADQNKWEPCADSAFEETGNIWIVKKDGATNDKQVESLCQHTGWNGDLTSIVNGTWLPTPCSFVINEEEYKGEKQFRISFVNAYDRTPGNVGNVTPEKAKALQDRFGSQFRALAGNVVRNNAPPAGKPSMPPKAAKAGPGQRNQDNTINGVGTGAKTPVAARAGEKEDDIPF